MGGQAFEAKRTSAFLFDPDDLVIIGVDTDDDEEHHLYDPRVKHKIPASMVDNITEMGVIETISVTKVGKSAVVVDGRRRVLAARKANKKLRDRGEEPVTVPALLKRGTEEGLMGMLISGNEHRLDDDPISRAEKAQKLKNRGRTNVAIGLYFGVSGTAIGNWLKVLDCIPAVKNAVRSGKITMSAAIELADMSPDGQKNALDEMLESGKKSVDDAKDHAGNSGGNSGGSRAPRKTLARKVVNNERAASVLGDGFLKGVLWAIGDLEPGLVEGLSDLIEDIE